MTARTLEEQKSGQRAGLQEQLSSAEASVRRLVDRLDNLWLDLRAAEDKQRTAESAAISAERKLSERYQELAIFANLLRQREEENEALIDRLEAISAQLNAEQEEKSDLQAKNARLMQEIEELSDRIIDQEQEKTSILEQKSRLSEEVHALSDRLREQEELFKEHLQWSARLLETASDQPGWWGVLPANFRQRRRQERLKQLGLFNAPGYLEKNPDVADAGLDPLYHYLVHGFAEGRSR